MPGSTGASYRTASVVAEAKRKESRPRRLQAHPTGPELGPFDNCKPRDIQRRTELIVGWMERRLLPIPASTRLARPSWDGARSAGCDVSSMAAVPEVGEGGIGGEPTSHEAVGSSTSKRQAN
ncbi:uncharacterized protein LOC134531887 [Bacillus rossius redtenbacheri]|uniref:uncharacterized protein LOC134531887 n=1 Tax=Bacillus rossius redtenbacheri TaxID=93214 RepID=UPI002FDD6E42